MTTIHLRLLGGLQAGRGSKSVDLDFPPGATVEHLEAEIKAMGFDLDDESLILSLSGRGLRQWPPLRPLEDGEEAALFPNITGG